MARPTSYRVSGRASPRAHFSAWLAIVARHARLPATSEVTLEAYLLRSVAMMAIDARSGRALPTRLDRSRSVDEILRELGKADGPAADAWQRPESGLAKVFGKLFGLFRR